MSPDLWSPDPSPACHQIFILLNNLAAVGAHLLCHLSPLGYSVHYWRDGAAEVDFVVARPGQLWALEVKSGRGGKTPGLPAFRKRFPKAKALLIGGGGVPLEEFFKNPPAVWFDSP